MVALQRNSIPYGQEHQIWATPHLSDALFCLICRAVPNKDKTTETAGFLIDAVVVNATDAEP